MIRFGNLFLMIFMSALSWGQSVSASDHPSGTTSSGIIEPGRTWLMSYKLVINPDKYPTTYRFRESVLLPEGKDIDGIHCLEIAVRDWSPEGQNQSWENSGSYLGEQDGKVYLFECLSDELIKRLILDFSLTEGDVFLIDGYEEYAEYSEFSIEAVTDTVMPHACDAKSRLCISLSRSDGERDVWVEGIGSAFYGVTGNMRFMIAGSVPQLLRCSQDGQLLYEADNFGSITGISLQRLDSTARPSFAYDLQGRKLKSVPKHGIYIKDGKKVCR